MTEEELRELERRLPHRAGYITLAPAPDSDTPQTPAYVISDVQRMTTYGNFVPGLFPPVPSPVIGIVFTGRVEIEGLHDFDARGKSALGDVLFTLPGLLRMKDSGMAVTVTEKSTGEEWSL